MSSPFSDLLEGRDRSLVISENDYFWAVLEKRPLVLGHVIIVSKREIDDLFDLTESELANLMVFSAQLARALKQVIVCTKVGVAVLGLETRHAHLHLVPIQSADDLNFTRAKLQPGPAVLLKTAQDIQRIICI